MELMIIGELSFLNVTVSIFDQFGKLINIISSNTQGWDGNYNGKKMLSDDYWFIVKRENGQEYKGHFTLKR
jgi:gliding motility-associated-like protein